ncbi:hypothetical protein Ndes2526B_g04773 [Nannochloris sp. 'desiccata']|nr:putative 3'-5' ssDNA/RNA exonuclease TatD [Chlorella desiccata (nom. nud.)]
MSASLSSAQAAGSDPSQSPPPLQQQPRRRPTQGELVEQILESLDFPHFPLIDIAINLTDRSFEKDLNQVLERSRRAGIVALVISGCCLRTTQAAQELSSCIPCTTASLSTPSPTAKFPNLYFTSGVHPHNAKQCDESTISTLRQYASHPNCVAIGECGLDYNRIFSPPEIQRKWFTEQIKLAEELGKPLFMHCRDAGSDFFDILRKHRRSVPGVVHCFTGDSQEAQEALDLGLYIGITGWICDERPERGAAALAALLPLIPDDRLVLETDAPYLTPRTILPSKKRPSRNEPALLQLVLRAVAKARGQSMEEVAERTTENAKRLFGI